MDRTPLGPPKYKRMYLGGIFVVPHNRKQGAGKENSQSETEGNKDRLSYKTMDVRLEQVSRGNANHLACLFLEGVEERMAGGGEAYAKMAGAGDQGCSQAGGARKREAG